MDLMFPPSARVSGANWQLIPNSAGARSIFTGALRTLARSGDRWRVSLGTQNAARDGETYNTRAALQALRANLSGQANRLWMFDPGYRPRGSFPATELLSNNTFANGTTGWTGIGTSLSAADRVMRVSATAANQPEFHQAVATTAYVPYVLRSMISDGAQSLGLLLGPYLGAGSNALNGYSTSRGLRTVSAVTDTAGPENMFPVAFSSASGYTAGAYVECPYTSLSRCALVDNGQNLLLRSEEFDNASWTKTGVTISANGTASPDGATTADATVEDSSTSAHKVAQSVTVNSSAADFSLTVSVKAGRQWCGIEIQENTGNTVIYNTFNLNTGAIGTSTATGANWSGLRKFIRDLGNGWYACTIVGRKTNAATSLTVSIYNQSSDSGSAYLGDGSSGLYLWRATLAQASVPTRQVMTTSAANSGTSQTGSALYIKGLPASTNGLLLPGDRFQIGTQLCKVTAALNSDAAGLGYLQFAPALRARPADNAPIIIHQPMGRFVLAETDGGWDDRPGVISDFAFDLEEALDA